MSARSARQELVWCVASPGLSGGLWVSKREVGGPSGLDDAPNLQHRGDTEEEERVRNYCHETLACLGRHCKSRPAVTTSPRMAKMNKKTGEGGVQTQEPGESQNFSVTSFRRLGFEKGLGLGNAQKSFLHMWQTN